MHFSKDGISLISVNGDIDRILEAELFFKSSKSFKECIKTASTLGDIEKKERIYNIFRLLKKHDQLPRLFESIILEYELIMSASCYAQFKRHRMMTQIPQSYSFALGIEIPPLVFECGFKEKILEHSQKALSLYNLIYKTNKYAADYVVLNGHKRRVYSLLNARELYHISRLRMDHHAQWEIQRLTKSMIESAAKRVPFIFDLCCGKDVFDDYKGRIQR